MTLPPEVIRAVPTPCLVIDLAAVDHNIAMIDDMLDGTTVALRPHFKAHKCRPLLQRQLANGRWSGVTCQTGYEALMLAQSGFTDILVSNQLVDDVSVRQAVVAAGIAHLTTVVDAVTHIDILDRATRGTSVTIDVLIEIDVGMGRCGIAAGDAQLIALAAALSRTDRLRLAGLQAYEGHAVGEADLVTRRALTAAAAAIADRERNRLVAAGYRCGIVSGGGTGTVHLAAGNGVLDEVQAGSYALMDASYARLDLGFRQAVHCVATVISRRDEHMAVVDAGLKQLSTDSGLPISTTPGFSVLGMSDEHTRLRLPGGSELAIGDRVTLVPSHLDPTMNLHQSVFAYSPDGLEEWSIDHRTASLRADQA